MKPSCYLITKHQSSVDLIFDLPVYSARLIFRNFAFDLNQTNEIVNSCLCREMWEVFLAGPQRLLMFPEGVGCRTCSPPQ